VAAATEAERRLALLKAAFREIAEKGFSEVTLEDVARRAGVSKGVTLYYFRSKEDLFREVFRWLIDSIHERMREAVEAEDDPAAKVRALVGMIFPSPSKNRAFFRAFVDFCGLASRRDAFREVNERFYEGCRAIDGGIVEEGVRRGVFVPRDPREAGSTMRAIFDGLMMQWLSEKDPEATFDLYR
jgi:TetR/AcrR family fatty acid metabolism transcriptional regulator